MPTFGIHNDRISRLEAPFEYLLCQRILQLLLDRTLQGARTIHRIETDIAQKLQRLVADLHLQLALRQTLFEIHQLDLRNGLDLLLVQRTEHDQLIESIDELGTEMRL